MTNAAPDMVELGRNWRPVLMAYFLRRVRNHAEAEDLTQEVLTRLVARAGDAAVPASDGYVFTIAANLLRDRARRHQVRAEFFESAGHTQDGAGDPIDPFRVLVGRAAVAAMSAALEQMPERTRDIFILFRMERMSQDMIAETMGISVSAVKKHVAKAMALLMAAMRDEL
jgi:RNA polymerase sigma-70 factor (ECF subfamily)